jgi:hypothetical protein
MGISTSQRSSDSHWWGKIAESRIDSFILFGTEKRICAQEEW